MPVDSIPSAAMLLTVSSVMSNGIDSSVEHASRELIAFVDEGISNTGPRQENVSDALTNA